MLGQFGWWHGSINCGQKGIARQPDKQRNVLPHQGGHFPRQDEAEPHCGNCQFVGWEGREKQVPAATFSLSLEWSEAGNAEGRTRAGPYTQSELNWSRHKRCYQSLAFGWPRIIHQWLGSENGQALIGEAEGGVCWNFEQRAAEGQISVEKYLLQCCALHQDSAWKPRDFAGQNQNSPRILFDGKKKLPKMRKTTLRSQLTQANRTRIGLTKIR